MRKIPWILIVLAYLSPLLGYLQMQRVIAEQTAAFGNASCGLAAVATMCLAVIAAGALSFLATIWRGFNVGWWRKNPWKRIALELPLFTLPLALALLMLAPFLYL